MLVECDENVGDAGSMKTMIQKTEMMRKTMNKSDASDNGEAEGTVVALTLVVLTLMKWGGVRMSTAMILN